MNYTQHVIQASFIQRSEEALASIFMDALKKTRPELHALAEETLAIQDQPTETKQDSYRQLFDRLDYQQTHNLLDSLAKYNNIKRKAKKTMGTLLANAREDVAEDYRRQYGEENGMATSDDFRYVVRQAKANNVSPDRLQVVLDENGCNKTMGTKHPTNQQSPVFIKGGMRIDSDVSDPHATGKQLRDDMAKLISSDVPYTGVELTNEDTIVEVIDLLKIQYDTTITSRNELNQILEEEGYGDVKIQKPLTHFTIWQTGDGDGNPNANYAALAEAIEDLRAAIKELYLQDLATLEGGDAIKEAFERGEHARPEDFAATLRELGTQEADDLAFKVDTYGYHFAQIDIRHNAEDVKLTLSKLAEYHDIIPDAKAFREQSEEAQQAQLSSWLEDDAIMQKLQSMSLEELHFKLAETAVQAGVLDAIDTFASTSLIEQSSIITGWMNDKDAIEKLLTVDKHFLENETTARITGRLQLIGQQPDMSDKLITAETEQASDGLAALALLKATGHKIAEEGANMNVVLLTEAVKDLERLDQTIEVLFNDEAFREQVATTGKFIFMIAKSDTTRRDGLGALSKQEEAIGKAFLKADEKIQEMKNKHGLEEDISVEVVIGGGESLMRGGGNPAENPHMVGIAIAHEARKQGKNATEIPMGPTQQTIQGHGLTSRYSGPIVAQRTNRKIISQNAYAALQLARDIPARNIHGMDEENREHIHRAKEDTRMGDEAAIKAQNKFKANPSFNELAKEAPWVGVKSVTTASGTRAAKRGQQLPRPGMTIEEIIGEKQELLNNRAISVDLLASHHGTYMTALLGVKEGLEAMAANGKAQEVYGEDPLHHSYQHDKMFRKKMFDMAQLLHMMDFTHAWRLAGKEHPGQNKIHDLAQQFDMGEDGKKLNDRDVTRAWLEVYAQDTARLVYKAMTGKEVIGEIEPKDVLREVNPELAHTMARREADAEAGRYMEEILNVKFQGMLKMPDREDRVVDEKLFKLTQLAHAVNNSNIVDITSQDYATSLIHTVTDAQKVMIESKVKPIRAIEEALGRGLVT